ncbi:MAG: hypothetical protein HPY58_01020 [Firmicutes bacterium]|nr:hypothetical protein [Bacillota bacterium]
MMKFQIPDVIGYLYEEGARLLQQAGYRIQIRFTGPLHQEPGKKARILRQREIGEKKVELIIGHEFYSDPA